MSPPFRIGTRWHGAMVVVALALIAPGMALGTTPGWQSSAQVLSRDGATTPEVVANAAGSVVAVWATSPASGDPAVQVATRADNGFWKTEGTISPAGEKATDPVAVVDSSDVITVAWVKGPPGAQVIQARRSTALGWLPPVELSDASGGRDARGPQLAVDSSGVVTATWYRDDGVANRVQAARFVNGGWTPAVDVVATGGDSSRPQVAVDPSGVPTVVWQQVDGTAVLVKASRLVNGTWTTGAVLSTQAPGVAAQMPQVAIDGAGVATVTWQESDNGAASVVHASRGQDGLWGTAAPLSAAGRSAVAPHVAVNPAGAAVVAWSRDDGSRTVPQAAWFVDGAWSQPATLAGGGNSVAGVDVAVDGAGTATAAWRTVSQDGASDQAWAVRSTGRSWQSPVALSGRSGQAHGPSVASDRAGITSVLWSFTRPGGGAVEANWFGVPPPAGCQGIVSCVGAPIPVPPLAPGVPRFLRELPVITLELSGSIDQQGTVPTSGGSMNVGVTCPSTTDLQRPTGTAVICSTEIDVTSTNFVTSGPPFQYYCDCIVAPAWTGGKRPNGAAPNSRRPPQAVLARAPRVVLQPGQARRVRAPVRPGMAWGIWARGVKAFPATVRVRVTTGGRTYTQLARARVTVRQAPGPRVTG